MLSGLGAKQIQLPALSQSGHISKSLQQNWMPESNQLIRHSISVKTVYQFIIYHFGSHCIKFLQLKQSELGNKKREPRLLYTAKSLQLRHALGQLKKGRDSSFFGSHQEKRERLMWLLSFCGMFSTEQLQVCCLVLFQCLIHWLPLFPILQSNGDLFKLFY